VSRHCSAVRVNEADCSARGITTREGGRVETPRRPLLCRLNLHHNWVRRFNADGEDYLQCTACGKDRYDVERHDPDIGSGFVGGMPS
jgi:hypothetical protein